MKTVNIMSWNDEAQEVEEVKITASSDIKLGCEGEPVVNVDEWMGDQEIKTLEEMAEYIDSLDFNVQVVD